MVTAAQIVELFLEAEGPGPAVYMYGPHLPERGSTFDSLMLAASWLQGRYPKPVSREEVQQALDEIGLPHGYTLVHVKAPNDIIVYASKLPARLPAEAAQELEQRLNLPPDARLIWRSNSRDNRGQLVSMGSAFVGVEPEEKQPAAPAQTPNPAPQAQAVEAPPAEPDNRPKASLGLAYDRRFRDGVYVLSPTDNGPVALSGIQAGDMIVAIQYDTASGQRNDRVTTPEELADALALVQPDTRVVLTVRRGPDYLNFPVKPVWPE